MPHEARSQGKKRRRKDEKDERDDRPSDAYAFSPGLRHVKPYVYHFGTNTKGRWVGRTIYDVYASEFGAQSNDYYKRAIEEGRITVDGKAVPCGFVLKGGNHISHCTHRHEPPVAGTSSIEIVSDTEDLLVVNKPSTVPMHPCGGYRFNSLFHILDSERKKAGIEGERLHIVHRLDRLTSGLSLFAKNAEVASRFGDDLRAGFTAKTYLARVCGDFGSGLANISGWRRPCLEENSLGWCLETSEVTEATKEGEESAAEVKETPSDMLEVISLVQSGSTLKLSQPISCVSQVDGVYQCPFTNQDPSTTISAIEESDKDGKSSRKAALWKQAATLFRKLSFNGKTSVVEVKPLHGRTHQIRLHLQHLGHPIANDPCYGGTLHYGDPFGGIGESSLFQDMYENAQGKEDEESRLIRDCRFCQPTQVDTSNTIEGLPAADASSQASSSQTPEKGGTDLVVRRNDQERHCGAIWLHALRYERKDEASPHLDWAFQTSTPEWAKEDFRE